MLNKMKYLLISPMLMIFSLHCSTQESSQQKVENGFDPSKSDAQAIQVVDEMWQALGGKDNWQKTRYLSFRWILEREGKVVADYRHDWERYTNGYRVEGTNREGHHFVVLFDTQAKQGTAYVDGNIMPADSTKFWIDLAYRRFINDSYWLIMPYKLNDPGVILNYEGEREIDGSNYDVVKVTFENVGLTPKDTYWAFIDKSTRLMHKWEYVLQDQQPPPTVAWWKEWQTIGGIKLALNREFENRPVRIYFKDVVVSPTVDEEIFELISKTF
ncbi:MAG: DUF6503 family protein [bacterium]